MSGGAASIRTVELPDGRTATLDVFTESRSDGDPRFEDIGYHYYSAYAMRSDGEVDDIFTTKDYPDYTSDEGMLAAERQFDVWVKRHLRMGRPVRAHTRRVR